MVKAAMNHILNDSGRTKNLVVVVCTCGVVFLIVAFGIKVIVSWDGKMSPLDYTFISGLALTIVSLFLTCYFSARSGADLWREAQRIQDQLKCIQDQLNQMERHLQPK